MDLVQLYTIVVGVLILWGTALTGASLAKVKPSRRPLYYLKTAAGTSLSVVFTLGYLLRWTEVRISLALFNVFFYLSFVVVALAIIVGTLIDRFEAKKVGIP